MVHGKMIAKAVGVYEAFDIHNDAGLHLPVYAVRYVGTVGGHILVFEFVPLLLAAWNHFIVQIDGKQGEEECTNHVRPKDAVDACPGVHDGDDFAAGRHLRSKKYNRYKDEQRQQHVQHEGQEVEEIIEDDGVNGSLVCDKVIQFLRYIEHHNNGRKQCQYKQQRAEVAFDNVAVENGEQSNVVIWKCDNLEMKCNYTCNTIVPFY